MAEPPSSILFSFAMAMQCGHFGDIILMMSALPCRQELGKGLSQRALELAYGANNRVANVCADASFQTQRRHSCKVRADRTDNLCVDTVATSAPNELPTSTPTELQTSGLQSRNLSAYRVVGLIVD